MCIIAIFVDKGFITKQMQALNILKIDFSMLNNIIVNNTMRFFSKASLHKVFWYDGPAYNKSENTDHQNLANLYNTQLFIGWRIKTPQFPNGLQKGVDSKIICDMLHLAYTKTITDAVLISGDLDFLPAIHQIKTQGVNPHLSFIEFSKDKIPENIAMPLQRSISSTIPIGIEQAKKALNTVKKPIKYTKTQTSIIIPQNDEIIHVNESFGENYTTNNATMKMRKSYCKKPKNNKKRKQYFQTTSRSTQKISQLTTTNIQQRTFRNATEIVLEIYEEMNSKDKESLQPDHIPQKLLNKAVQAFFQKLGLPSVQMNKRYINIVRSHLLKIAFDNS